jgi:hypothetical protein
VLPQHGCVSCFVPGRKLQLLAHRIQQLLADLQLANVRYATPGTPLLDAFTPVSKAGVQINSVQGGLGNISTIAGMLMHACRWAAALHKPTCMAVFVATSPGLVDTLKMQPPSCASFGPTSRRTFTPCISL